MKNKTWFQRRLEEELKDPEFAAAFYEEKRKIEEEQKKYITVYVGDTPVKIYPGLQSED